MRRQQRRSAGPTNTRSVTGPIRKSAMPSGTCFQPGALQLRTTRTMLRGACHESCSRTPVYVSYWNSRLIEAGSQSVCTDIRSVHRLRQSCTVCTPTAPSHEPPCVRTCVSAPRPGLRIDPQGHERMQCTVSRIRLSRMAHASRTVLA